MTIDEAIKVLECFGVDIKYWKDDEGEKALSLGIEALKLIRDIRSEGVFLCPGPLPGETEEVKDE